MCGIAALVGMGSSVDSTALCAMATIVRHRGPDDGGAVLFLGDVWRANAGSVNEPSEFARSDVRVALAHRRLAIVDLSDAGHQPMSSSDSRYWIVFNGEIYNYIELRKELISLGHVFQTATDTEVLLAAYSQWGEHCLHRMNGMFAFVLVDRLAKRVFAARDRFGVKPLYWWRSPSGFVAFASEIKQFTVLPGWSARLNGPRARDFLTWGILDHTAETLFADVRQLRGGEYLMLDPLCNDAVVQPRRWYLLVPAQHSGCFEDSAREFRALFEDSCGLRLRADVPVGSCLSGGLDSSSIVCVVNRILATQGAMAQQRTFSARSAEPRYDEGLFIEAVRSQLGVEHHEVTPPLAELPATLSALTWHQDEPFGSTSIYAQWCVFALASRQGVKVMLDGQGADELLAGYRGFLGPRFATLVRNFQFGTLAGDMHATRGRLGVGYSRLLQYLAGAILPSTIALRMRSMVGLPSGLDENWFDSTRLMQGGSPSQVDISARPGSIAAMSRTQLFGAGMPMLLHWEDRNSMAHGVEARLPFLDYRVVEFGLALPDDFKLAGGVTKRVLREAMRGVLPELVRDRRDKIGFATPEEPWLKGAGRAFMRETIAQGIATSDGVLTRKALMLFDTIADGRRPFSFVPWRIASFGAWMSRFGVTVG
jgi:asparagine synthase (glutamine-hydrolysing)